MLPQARQAVDLSNTFLQFLDGNVDYLPLLSIFSVDLCRAVQGAPELGDFGHPSWCLVTFCQLGFWGAAPLLAM